MSARPATSSNSDASTPSRVEPVAQPAPPGVVAGAAGQRDVARRRARRSPRRSPPRRRSAGRTRRPRPGRRRGRSQIEVDERLAEAQRRARGRRPAAPCSRGRTLSSPRGARRRAHDQLDGSPVFYRSAPGPRRHAALSPRDPDELRRLGRRSWSATGGIAPDLIGFGRSGKGGHLDYSIDGLPSSSSASRPARLEAVQARRARLGRRRRPDVRPPPSRAGRAARDVSTPPPLFDGFAWPRLARCGARAAWARC